MIKLIRNAAMTVALFAFAGTIAISNAQQAAPDLILSNGKIITVDQRFTIAEAVAIKNDRVIGVGSNQEILRLAGSGTKKIDLKGKSVIPGLIDNHMHLLRGGTTWQRELRWDGVESRKQALDMLRARAKALGPGEWIYTIGGWAHHQFTDDPKPFTREELDRVAPDNPVALQESYYRTFLNTKAMQVLGIDDKQSGVSNLPKDAIIRDGAGKPTGVIEGGMPGVRPIVAKLPPVAKENVEASSLAMIEDMNRAGLTTFGVPGCDRDLVSMYRRWEDQKQLNVRVFCIDGLGANTPEQVDKILPEISKIKLFQGDSHIDRIFYGEGVYGPLSDPMLRVKADPKARDLVAAAAHCHGGRQEPACPSTSTFRCKISIDAFPRSNRGGQQVSTRSRICAGCWPM